MSSAPLLFDQDLRRARIARARRLGVADFLHREAAAELDERLSLVNRSFQSPALVCSFPDVWRETCRALSQGIWVPPADNLALEPGQHDLIVHALELHVANDPVGQLIQSRHALRPDGLCVAVMFGGQTLAELRAALAEAEVATRGGLSPRVAPMGEIRDLGGLLQRAGFALPVADSLPLRVDYASPIHLMRDLRAMGETNTMTARDRRPLDRSFLSALMAAYPTRPDGRIEATFEIVTLTGWAPAETQPRPLRPGSATTRLAEALGTQEKSAGEKAGK